MTQAKDYLLTGAAPTPNGRLHLGHVGAQFLKLDVLKRHAWRVGGRATLLFSVDAFDNPITFTAHRQGLTEEQVCRIYIDGIARDLRDVAIDYDTFLDSSTGAGLQLVSDIAVELDGQLAERKVAVVEKIPHSTRTGAPVTGRFLVGECPSCGRVMHGFSCDPCGLYLSPENILNVRAADPQDSLEWREITNYFLRTDMGPLRDYVNAVPLPDVTRRKVTEIAELMLAGDEYLARWTASEPWGVGTGVPGQVFFNRLLITLVEQVAFGELTRQKLGLSRNPFEDGSDVVTVLAYGVDNLGGFIIENSALSLGSQRYNPFQHHLVSEFYTLQGEKMSTSRPHALWVADMAELEEFTRDGLRGYMASIATPDVEVDVSLADLTRFMATTKQRMAQVVAACAAADPRDGMHHDVLTLAEKALDRQSAALELTHIDLPAVWHSVDEWVHRVLSEDTSSRYATLAGFAVVAAALTPDVAADVWQRLGHSGQPDRAALRGLAGAGS